ncbi:MAG: PspC domain-containing protein [Bacteroidales bacterium]|nr:PspC domain-containing protein [Bacteroidales bacterium]
MKKVVKVSIGNLAFTIEEEGFLIIKGYLNELHDHYDNKENGQEIIEGIEERMAELFVEKCGANNVVTSSAIKEVISILGRPDVIDEEQGYSSSTNSSSYKNKIPKRLFRNPDNKVLGGVCSGLAAYTSIDTTLVRVLFVLLFIGFSFFGLMHVGGGGFMIFAYIVMWIVIPEARTVEQRCAMYGEPLDLNNFQRQMERGFNQAGKGIRRAGREGVEAMSTIATIISKIVSVFLIVISLGGLIFFSFLFLGVEIFKDVVPVDFLDYIEIGIENPVYLKVAFLCMIFLPFIGMLYGGIHLLFGFRPQGIRPGLIIFILWIISIFTFGILATKASRPFWSDARSEQEVIINDKYDTLYVRFESSTGVPSSRVMLNAGYSDYTLFWMEGEKKSQQIVAFPQFKIVRQSKEDGYLLKSRSDAHSYTYSEALVKAQKNLPSYEITDSLITIKPNIYSKQNKFDATFQQVMLYIPEGVKVIVTSPIEHDFERRIERDWIFNCDRNRRYDDRWEGRYYDFKERMERKKDRIERKFN